MAKAVALRLQAWSRTFEMNGEKEKMNRNKNRHVLGLQSGYTCSSFFQRIVIRDVYQSKVTWRVFHLFDLPIAPYSFGIDFLLNYLERGTSRLWISQNVIVILQLNENGLGREGWSWALDELKRLKIS